MTSKSVAGWPYSDCFSDFDRRLADFVSTAAGSSDPLLLLAVALTSRMVTGGDVCLDLNTAAAEDCRDASFPSVDEWRRALQRSPAVGRPGEHRPLILDAADRLYFYRYWEIESELAAAIRARIAEPVTGIDQERLRDGLRRLFGPRARTTVDWQAVACIAALYHRFAVISGGPGTGKTTTVAKILALLVEQAGAQRPRILLTAPTGKAAARLAHSLRSAKSRMNCRADVLAAIPESAATLHRLLQPKTHSPYFVHDRDNRLPCDVMVVDEASMVDIALMSRLCQALEPDARLILVGDRDQLSSVEAGSVLGDICDRQRSHGFSLAFAGRVAALTGTSFESRGDAAPSAGRLADSIVVLQHSYRFDAAGGIGRLGRAVNSGDAARMWDCLEDGGDPLAVWHPTAPGDGFERLLAKQTVRGYREYLASEGPEAALERLERFQVLCALRSGRMGVAAVNETARRALMRADLLPPTGPGRLPWYRGRPVLMTRNDYSLGLFNGDMGVTWPETSADPETLRVFFAGSDGKPRRFSPNRLGEHETAFAMTVHKSQGSEFDDVLLLLPERDSPVLTRELLYTAVTRARRSVTIYGSRAVLENAVARRIRRTSGLRDRLWGQPNQPAEDFK